MTLQEIEKWFEEWKLRGALLMVIKMEWLIERIKELEANIPDPEWCCAEHKKKLLERIKELESERRRDALSGQATMEEAYKRRNRL